MDIRIRCVKLFYRSMLYNIKARKNLRKNLKYHWKRLKGRRLEATRIGWGGDKRRKLGADGFEPSKAFAVRFTV